jgi:outer membrane protein
MKRFVICLALFLAAVSAATAGRADELPLWEAGVGFSGLSIPDYRGSDRQRGYAFPIPYLIYRGDVLKLDRKGLQGLLFRSDRVQLNISGDAGVPVKSDRNDARRGMPDLNPTFQIGPSLEICISNACDNDRSVQIRLPVRVVFATDFSRISAIGYVFNPQLNVDYRKVGPGRAWNFGFAAGPLFATAKYNEYYYEVAPQYAIPVVRPAYDARGGYSGSVLIAALTRRFDRLWFGSFARYDALSGAVFEDSPLVKTRHSWMAGFGIAWVFDQSATRVHASE